MFVSGVEEASLVLCFASSCIIAWCNPAPGSMWEIYFPLVGRRCLAPPGFRTLVRGHLGSLVLWVVCSRGIKYRW